MENVDAAVDNLLKDKTPAEQVAIMQHIHQLTVKKNVADAAISILVDQLEIWREDKHEEGYNDAILAKAIGKFANKYNMF